MENKINLDNITDEQQERMCELCEELILECCSSSSTFQCEGSQCDRAFEYLVDDMEDEKNDSKLTYKMQLKTKKVKKHGLH